ncbi:hypothetical protein BD410DRAFT_794377 [Rickenella mellea]|uniref:Uncharacterized protein n=1 Tax=Rickenella mellea TaxID=50990 RepID=A0A4Y7PQH5_9AGAM|nr:hypothetical protein BD410DRAFT_794377 [Rickenella mellea]
MQQLHGPDNNIPIRTPRKNTFTLSLEHRSSPFHTLLREQYDYGTSPTKKTCRLSLASSSLRQQWQRVQSAQTRLDRQRDIVRSRHHPYQNSISRHPPSFSSRLSRSSAIFHMGRTKLESLLLSRVGEVFISYLPTYDQIAPTSSTSSSFYTYLQISLNTSRHRSTERIK